MVTKGPDGRWYKPCPECNQIQSYLRKNYAELSAKLNKTCKSCSNKKTENSNRGYYEDIRISWFKKFETQAALREIKFEITIEDVWNKYILQDKMCALSGLKIGWELVGTIHTASIDRIDSTIGYKLNNIQLVHKDINMMKQQFSQEKFVEFCKLVADKVKW
jgi:hypothetical protein